MDPFHGSSDYKSTQNKLGAYISVSIWVVTIVFSFYYFAMGIPVTPLLFLSGIAVVGLATAQLFRRNKNKFAVIFQCLWMYLALITVLTFPVVGKYAIMCILIIALTPVVLLNEMLTGVIFLNLVTALMILTTFELARFSPVEPLEKILDFFIKFMVIIFVFVQVYGLRVMFERKNQNHNHQRNP